MRQNNRKLYGPPRGAIYVALTMVFAPISFGPVQFRIAEALLHHRFLYAGSRLFEVPLSNSALRGHASDVVFGKPGHAYWRSWFMVSEKAQVVRVHSSNYGQHQY